MSRTWLSASGLSLCVGSLLSWIPGAMAQEDTASAAPVAPDRIGAASALVELLEESEQAQLMRDFNDPERHGWSFFPARRTSLRIGDLDDEERGALVDFLEVALGENGLKRVREVRTVEPVTDRGGGVVTGPDEYHLTFFGPISSTEPWGWRLEGHHIALNQTLVGSKLLAVTPSFLGSAPVRNENGLEPLGREIRLARFCVEQLEGDVREQVMEEDVPREIVTGMNVDWEQPRGRALRSPNCPPPSGSCCGCSRARTPPSMPTTPFAPFSLRGMPPIRRRSITSGSARSRRRGRTAIVCRARSG